MTNDKPPKDGHSSPHGGDADERARQENPKLAETTEIEETTPIFPDQDQQTSDDLAKTVANEIDVTVDGIDPTASLETSQLRSDPSTNKTVSGSNEVTQELGSRLDDVDVTRTINPRELSKEDVTLWNELTVDSIAQASKESAGPSERQPATEQSFSETKLLIRDRNVAAAKDDPNTPSDYRLVRMLGKGGMGNVYVARQGSLDRLIAVKVIRPLDENRRQQLEQTGRLDEVERDRRHQFLSEAVVTGDLDHPNIVPIHDIAVTSDNTLFYAMKRVIGTPWSKVIQEKSRDENLDILLKVCDAIGFAHTRGVVHRDIKPENIMLGDFGVVMVMDWGLALAQPEFEKIDSITHAAGLGGTPAFMAPEMATGPLQKIGPAADIYLLGATLFYIVTGTTPHGGENVSQCLKAVTANEIREVEERHRGELLEIALKAMATDPHDRYADVRVFQQSIRQYRSHAESISLTARADYDLRLARKNLNYADFSRARFGFEQALSLWSGNEPAQQGLAETTIAHASASHESEDFDLGLSLLDAGNESHRPLIEKLQAGRRLRQQRVSRLRLFKTIAAAMLAFILVGGTIAVYVIDLKRSEAVLAKDFAEQQKQIAVAQKEEAQLQKEEAQRQKEEANRQETKAKQQEQIAVEANKKTEQARVTLEVANADLKVAQEETKAALANETEAKQLAEQERLAAVDAANKEKQQREIADAQTRRAEYETYLSQTGLANARIESNEFDDARRILGNIRTMRESQGGGLAWEWRWLWRQANQSSSSNRSPAALIDVAIATDTIHSAAKETFQRGIAVLANGQLQPFVIDEDGTIRHHRTVTLTKGAEATAVAISDSDDQVAIGTTRGDIQIWDRDFRQLHRTLTGHESRVTRLQFIDDSILLSGSTDKTARAWDVHSPASLETCWHIAAVRDLAARRINGDVLLVTAVADSTTGRAVVWSLRGDEMKSTQQGECSLHNAPVTSIALSPDGKTVATGDVAGNLFLWQPSSVSTTNYSASIASAVKGLASSEARKPSRNVSRQAFDRMTDPSVVVDDTQLVSTSQTQAINRRAHNDIVESIRFSQDGQSLLTASDDYTLKVWEPKTLSLRKTLRGHGGWVTDAAFLGRSRDEIVSVSSDMTIRRWDANSYVGATTRSGATPKTSSIASHGNTAGNSQAQAHLDEIWSARFDSGGTRIVSASRDHSARVLEIDPITMAFAEVATMQHDQEDRLSEGTAFMAMSFAVDRNHNRLVVGSADATVRIWDLEKGNELGRATGTGLNSSFALSRDGSLLLTGSSSTDDKAILWRIDPTGQIDPKILWRIKAHDQAVTAFAISDDGKMFFTGDRHGLGNLWDVTTGKRIGASIEEVRGYRINAAHFTPDGRQLLLAADDQQVTRIEVTSRKPVGRLAHDGFVTQLSLSADGKQAVTVSESTTPTRVETAAKLWDLASGKSQLLYRIDSNTDTASEAKESARINSAHFGDQSRWVVVSVGASGANPARVMRWDSRDKNIESTKPKTLQLPRQLNSLQAAMPIGSQRMATLNGDAAFLWDLESMNHIKSYRDHGAIAQAAFSHDGKFVVTASRSVKIWDAATGRSLGKLESPHEGLVRSIDFSPTKHEIATAGDDGIARRWSWNPETQQFRLVNEFDAGRNDPSKRKPLRCVRFSPDAKSLLVAGDSGTARLWPLASNTSQSFTAYDLSDAGDFTCAAFSADGNWIVLGSDDKIARMLRVVDVIQTPSAPINFVGHADRIEDVAVVQDASKELRILTASRDKSARVWDPRIGSEDRMGREVIALRRHTQGVTAVDATSDGRIVMTAGRDGAVILWPAEAAEPPHPRTKQRVDESVPAVENK